MSGTPNIQRDLAAVFQNTPGVNPFDQSTLNTPLDFIQNLQQQRHLAIMLSRAQRGSGVVSASVGNNGQLSIFNNTKQNHVIVVRTYSAGPAAALPLNILNFYGSLGSTSGTVVNPIIPGRAMLPGQVFANAGSNLGTAADYVDYQGYSGAALSTGFPFSVLPPNWSFVLNSTVANQALTVSFLWECLTPDEFTLLYGEYAE